MHNLDSLIDDIEPRILAIIKSSSGVDSSIQTSLVAYCWILLDSWIAWSTYRFLLRDTEIDPSVSEKWFQTPSSYSASQLKAVWKFGEEEIQFFESHTGSSIKNAIDKVIQDKRNSAAHFKKGFSDKIRGDDTRSVSNYYSCFSVLFRYKSVKKFIEKINNDLKNQGPVFIESVSFSDDERFPLADMDSHFNDFVSSEMIKCFLNNESVLIFDKKKENAYYDNAEERMLIPHGDSGGYNLFGNKGFYLNDLPIVSTVLHTMPSNGKGSEIDLN